MRQAHHVRHTGRPPIDRTSTRSHSNPQTLRVPCRQQFLLSGARAWLHFTKMLGCPSATASPICCASIHTLRVPCRQQFSLSRARANYRRMAKMQGRFSKLPRFVASIAEWEHPLRSMAAMVVVCILSFHPHVVLPAKSFTLNPKPYNLKRPHTLHPKACRCLLLLAQCTLRVIAPACVSWVAPCSRVHARLLSRHGDALRP